MNICLYIYLLREKLTNIRKSSPFWYTLSGKRLGSVSKRKLTSGTSLSVSHSKFSFPTSVSVQEVYLPLHPLPSIKLLQPFTLYLLLELKLSTAQCATCVWWISAGSLSHFLSPGGFFSYLPDYPPRIFPPEEWPPFPNMVAESDRSSESVRSNGGIRAALSPGLTQSQFSCSALTDFLFFILFYFLLALFLFFSTIYSFPLFDSRLYRPSTIRRFRSINPLQHDWVFANHSPWKEI